MLKKTALLLILATLFGGWKIGQSNQFFASDGEVFTLEGLPTNPQAFYDAGQQKIWAAWGCISGGSRYICLNTWTQGGGWGAEQLVAANPNTDGHGAPGIVMDQYSCVHVFYGGHHSNPLYSYTTNPGDGTAWTSAPHISCSCSFYQPMLVNGVIYLVTTSNVNGYQDIDIIKGTPSPSCGVPSWTDLGSITNFGSFAAWAGNAVVNGSKICLPFSYTNDIYIADAYYGCYDTSNGSFSNIDASTIIAAGSLPISRGTAQASFEVYGTANTSLSSLIPSQVVDGSGTTHVLFANGSWQTGGAGSLTLYESHWTGSVWSAPVSYGTTQNLNAIVAAVPASDGGFNIYWPQVTSILLDLYSSHWTSGGGFSSAKRIAVAPGPSFFLLLPVTNDTSTHSIIIGAQPTNAGILWFSGGNVYAAYSTSNPIPNPTTPIYLYGDNGFIP